MKATGIVRRIDDLGRVVIPKEIRRVMRIREGDPLEIFTGKEGEVIFKKYSAMEGDARRIQIFADALSRAAGMPAALCDRDTVLCVSGIPRKDYADRNVSDQVSELMQERVRFLHKERAGNDFPLVSGQAATLAAAVPIISESDCVGAVLLLGAENGKEPGEEELRLCKTLAVILGGQLEN